MITINDMFQLTKRENIPLLSDYESDFWQEYVNNFSTYDLSFRRLFYGFSYFLHTEGDLLEVTTDFIADVRAFLLCNDKKYKELYRTYVISDDDYMLVDNYNITETKTGTIIHDNTFDFGAKSETEGNTVGSRTDTSTNSSTIGGRSDSSSSSIGEQNISSTTTVAPYDEDVFHNKQHDSSVNGSRSDSSTNTIGSQTNSENISNVTGEQTSSRNNSMSAYQNSSLLNEDENYVLTRKGNIGVQTGSDMLQKHENFWTKYEFYTFIFKEISDALLSLVD